MNIRDFRNGAPGKCGLANLGNTCYMASAIQCLSNIPILRDFLISDAYLQDVSEEFGNPVRGMLATTIAEMFKEMWSGDFSSITPQRLKMVIATLAPRFNNNNQQDAHEFMAYVLDILHDDLNRVKVKPSFEINDEMYRLPSVVLAIRSWEMYKARNDSIIIDLLHGQLKSTLTCPICATVSTRFDPFASLSLPLPPQESITKQSIIVMFKDRKWIKVTMDVNAMTTVTEAEEQIMNILQPDQNHYFVAFCLIDQMEDEVQLLRPNESVRIRGCNVYFCEVQHNPVAYNARIFIAYNRDRQMCSCSLPMIYSLPPALALTRGYLYTHVLEYTKKMFLTEAAVVDLEAVDDEDEMLSPNALAARLPYKLYVVREEVPIAMLPTYDRIAFPDDDKPEWRDAYENYVEVIFQWKSMRFFNENSEEDMIHRDVVIATDDTVNLIDLVDTFTAREQLGEENTWNCPSCKKEERAYKQLQLWKMPEILIVHLKRFQHSEWSVDKLMWEVNIPVFDFDLTSKIADPNRERTVYELIGVSKHFGSLQHGHYTATCFNDKIRKWVDFNDSFTRSISDPTPIYKSHDPYMLIFKKKPVVVRKRANEPSREDGPSTSKVVRKLSFD